MFKFNLFNKPSFKIDEEIITKIFSEIDIRVKNTQTWTINIVIVTDEEIRNLNKTHRGIDKITDVLSFHYYDNFEWLSEDEVSWEILMSEKKIFFQWEEFKHWPEKEFYKLLIHSILHIIWYDHETEKDYKSMKLIEDQIWKII